MKIDGLEVKTCPYCGYTGPVVLCHHDDGFIIYCGRYPCNRKYSFIGDTKEVCIKNWNEEAEKVLKKYEGGEA